MRFGRIVKRMTARNMRRLALRNSTDAIMAVYRAGIEAGRGLENVRITQAAHRLSYGEA